MALRDYQTDLYLKIRKSLASHKGVIGCLPCRAGKSYIMLQICEDALKKGSKVLILAHRQNLINQHKELISMPNVRIASVFTEANHLGENGPVDLIMIDEAHISGCRTYHDVCDYYGCKRIGFTATPARLDGQPLDLFDDIVEGISADELISKGNISDYDLYAPKVGIDLSKVSIGDGDYSSPQLETVMCDKKIYGDVLKYYKSLADGKQAIAYCSSVKHSKEVCDMFNEAGYPAKHLDGTMRAEEREAMLNEYKNGGFLILCCMNVISEGITLPSCEVGMLLRPTQSLALYIQQACRCLTPKEGKKAIIIDFVGNCYRHGKPTDKQEWSLSERKRCRNPSGEPEVLCRQCPECLRVYRGKDPICPYCGAKVGKTKKEIQQEKEAELARIDAINKRERRMEVGKARTRSELEAIAKQRGYDRKWVWVQCKIKNIPY